MEIKNRFKFFYAFLKGIFEYNLMSLFREIYILTHHLGFEASFIDTTPPIEREFYLLMYEDEKKKEQDKTQNSPNQIGSPINTI